jgi:hypothetical protein
LNHSTVNQGASKETVANPRQFYFLIWVQPSLWTTASRLDNRFAVVSGVCGVSLTAGLPQTPGQTRFLSRLANDKDDS